MSSEQPLLYSKMKSHLRLAQKILNNNIYCLVVVNWNLWGEEIDQGRSKSEAQGTKLVPVSQW